jgi:hypothetical protein
MCRTLGWCIGPSIINSRTAFSALGPISFTTVAPCRKFKVRNKYIMQTASRFDTVTGVFTVSPSVCALRFHRRFTDRSG